MSNHNYSQYSKQNGTQNNQNRNFNNNKPKFEPKRVEESTADIPTAFVTGMSVGPIEPIIEPAINLVQETSQVVRPSLVNETVETKSIPELVSGTVVGCTKLNVRAIPSITGDVIAILSADSDVKIDITKSNHEWFHVCTATGIEGYCMRKFVNAYL